MRCIAFCAALTLAAPFPALAQSQTSIEKVVGARLMVSEFMRICVRTDADPAAIEDLALEETWIPDAPSSIQQGLTRPTSSDITVYTFTRSRSTSAGRLRSDFQVVVPAEKAADCTMEFENVSFALARQSLDASGFPEETDALLIPEGAPTRIKRTRMCQAETSYSHADCVELAVDPASYPTTGQLTLVGREED